MDRDRFLRAGFAATAGLFERNLTELKASDTRIDTDFERIDSRSLAASVYLDGKRVGQIGIWYGGGTFGNALCLSYDGISSGRNSMNDWLPVESTRQGLAFGARSSMSYRQVDGPLDAEGAAAYFWDSFLDHVRVRLGSVCQREAGGFGDTAGRERLRQEALKSISGDPLGMVLFAAEDRQWRLGQKLVSSRSRFRCGA